MVVGLSCYRGLEVDTSIPVADVYMFVLGLGLGFVMQVLVLAVQNAVDYGELGVATSGATLFRSMGGSIGVPIFGAIFANQLDSKLADAFPQGVGTSAGSLQGSPAEIAKLPPAIHDPYITAYVDSLDAVFLAAAVVAVVAFALTWFLREVPLRSTIEDQRIDEAFLADLFAAPRDESSLHELENKLSLLAGRENRHWIYQALAERAPGRTSTRASSGCSSACATRDRRVPVHRRERRRGPRAPHPRDARSHRARARPRRRRRARRGRDDAHDYARRRRGARGRRSRATRAPGVGAGRLEARVAPGAAPAARPVQRALAKQAPA